MYFVVIPCVCYQMASPFVKILSFWGLKIVRKRMQRRKGLWHLFHLCPWWNNQIYTNLAAGFFGLHSEAALLTGQTCAWSFCWLTLHWYGCSYGTDTLEWNHKPMTGLSLKKLTTSSTSLWMHSWTTYKSNGLVLGMSLLVCPPRDNS